MLCFPNIDFIVFKPSDFGIINTDGHSDFDIEKHLTLQDPQGRKLDLKLNYMYVHIIYLVPIT